MLAEQNHAPSLSADLVYVKTDKGRAEITQRSNGLDRRQRSLLIMLDGHKSNTTLAALLPGEPVETMLQALLALALVTPVALATAVRPAPSAALATDTAHSAPTAPAIRIDAQCLDEVKAMLIESARNCLGLLAADVVRQVESADDGDQLLRCIGHWHMAMQASKRGKDVAHAQLEHIKRSLRAAVAV